MTAKIELVKCNAGHETSRAMWDCPVCVDKIRQENEKLRKIISKCPNENDDLGYEYTHVVILKNKLDMIQRGLQEMNSFKMSPQAVGILQYLMKQLTE